jgi:hypothetical protein
VNRLPNETMQQYRGRQKREINAANDALKLEKGEPIRYGGRNIRYRPGMLDKHRPSQVTRLHGTELAEFLRKEKEEDERREKFARHNAEREKFRARQDVQDAETIRYLIESELEKIINRLTPAEWAAFRKKLEV